MKAISLIVVFLLVLGAAQGFAQDASAGKPIACVVIKTMPAGVSQQKLQQTAEEALSTRNDFSDPNDATVKFELRFGPVTDGETTWEVVDTPPPIEEDEPKKGRLSTEDKILIGQTASEVAVIIPKVGPTIAYGGARAVDVYAQRKQREEWQKQQQRQRQEQERQAAIVRYTAQNHSFEFLIDRYERYAPNKPWRYIKSVRFTPGVISLVSTNAAHITRVRVAAEAGEEQLPDDVVHDRNVRGAVVVKGVWTSLATREQQKAKAEERGDEQ